MLKSRGKERKMTQLLIKGIPITLLLEEDKSTLNIILLLALCLARNH